MIMVGSLTFGTPSGDFLSRKVGWVVLAVLGLGLLVLAGCQAKRSPTPDNAAPATKGISVNRITYVSPDANLFTIKPDGSDIKKLTGGLQARSLGGRMAQRLDFRNTYAWPTWSPDGGKLAASRVQIGGERAEVSVEVIDTATGRARTIFRNDPSVASLVAQTAPHYLYWAPDGHSLAFVAPTPQGLTLFVSNTEDASDPTVVQIGSPIYFHWAKDGSSMLLHTAREVRLAQRPFTSAFTELTDEAVGFRAPVPLQRWNLDGLHGAIVIWELPGHRRGRQGASSPGVAGPGSHFSLHVVSNRKGTGGGGPGRRVSILPAAPGGNVRWQQYSNYC